MMELPFRIPMDVVSYRRVKRSTAYLFLSEPLYAHCRCILLLYLDVLAQFSFINNGKNTLKFGTRTTNKLCIVTSAHPNIMGSLK
jgi:hypothetical protein